MTTSIAKVTFKNNLGVLFDPTSVVLSDVTSTYGIKRNDTDATVVADGTAMTQAGTGVYQHEFTDPAADLTYSVAVEYVEGGSTHHTVGTLEGSSADGNFTYDASAPTSNLHKVRLLTQDTTEATAFFTDEEINVFLSFESSNVLRAAAMALEAIAANRARLARKARVLNAEDDTKGVAKELRDQAAALRRQDEETPASAWVEKTYTPMNAALIKDNEDARAGN